MNKYESFAAVMALSPTIVPAEKCEMMNIVFPEWKELDIIKDVFRQDVKTKEAPKGHRYEEEKYRVVLRIYDGKVYDEDDRLDVYCWSREDFLKKAKSVAPIGVNSGRALLNLTTLLNSIKDEDEKVYVANMFSTYNRNFLYVHSWAEKRNVVEVTQEMYDAGITSVVDEWVNDETETKLSVGDFLVINQEAGTLYTIDRKAFLATHKLL